MHTGCPTLIDLYRHQKYSYSNLTFNYFSFNFKITVYFAAQDNVPSLPHATKGPKMVPYQLSIQGSLFFV